MATKLITVSTLDEFKTKMENEIPDSVQYSIMPTASADLVGKIVQYTGEDAPGLGYDLINGHWYKCESWGTGYIWTDLYTDSISNSSKPVISSAVSSALQAKQNIIQVAEMPAASSTRVGDILQYIGTTTASYTNGYFYKCVNNSGTYSWQAIDVQAGGGDVSGKADKVSSATSGNFAGLDSNGNLTDSGKKASDFATSTQGGKADTAVQTIQIGGTAQTKSNGVVNLPAYPTTLPASDTTSSYSASGMAPVNGTAVAAALGTLDVSSVGGNGKYIQSISETNGKISATVADMPTSLPASDVHDWAKASSKPSYTASEVGAIATTTKGAANGVAELDSAGKVPSSQLPSFVDDVLEYTAKANFPTTGEAGKIYVDKTTNLTWRWSGSAYVEISPSLALGETSSTAYRGDRGATAYSHATDSNRLTTAKSEGLYKIATTVEGHVKSVTAVKKSDITGLGIPSQDTTYSAATQSAAGLMSAADKTKLDGIATGAQVNAVTSVAGKTGAVTLNSSDVGLGNVGNFKAVSTVASQGLSSTEQANARANIGAGTSSFNGAYSSLSGKPTLGTAAAKNVASSGNASTTQVVMGNDTRLSDARTPKSHSHDVATTSNAGFMSASDKTKLNGLANIKSVGSGLDLNGSTGELTATGGGGESDIQVFKSTDFDPILYYNYYYPVIVFDGKAGGKILGIKMTDANGKTRSFKYDYLKHHGSNLLFPWVSNKILDTVTSYGVTVRYLGKGQYSVQGTATRTDYITIGEVRVSYVYDIADAQLYTKIFNAVGEYGSLKIGGYYAEGACGFDEVKAFNSYGTSRSQTVYLHITSGETYNCTFYAEIAPMCFSSVSLDKYEAPFGFGGSGYSAFVTYNSLGLRDTYTASNSYYLYRRNANTSNFGVIDYPILHTGKNIFVYTDSGLTDPSQLPVIEIYYTEEPQTTIKDNIAEIEYSISNGHLNKFVGYGSCTIADPPGHNYVKINAEFAKRRSPVTPEGLWFKVISTAGTSSTYNENYADFMASNFKKSTDAFYVPKSDFYYYNDELYVYGRWNPFLAVGSTYYYSFIPDWDGFDDSVTL